MADIMEKDVERLQSKVQLYENKARKVLENYASLKVEMEKCAPRSGESLRRYLAAVRCY